MEREKNIRKRNAIILVIVFHLIGFIGLLAPLTRARFLEFVPYHLLIMTIIVLSTYRGDLKPLLRFMLPVVIGGFAIELIGVHTGLFFGDYQYGSTLGPKVAGVPLIIGVNWFLLVYCMGVFMQRGRIKGRWPRIIVGAVGLALLDVLIEPIADRLNYWHWADNDIPYRNYICWFILSGLFLFVFERFNFRRQSIVAEVVLIMQFVLFAALLYALRG